MTIILLFGGGQTDTTVYPPSIRAEVGAAILIHEMPTMLQVAQLDAPALGRTVGVDIPTDITWENAANMTWENGTDIEWANTITVTPNLHEVKQ